jgi:hypothetical protein
MRSGGDRNGNEISTSNKQDISVFNPNFRFTIFFISSFLDLSIIDQKSCGYFFDAFRSKSQPFNTLGIYPYAKQLRRTAKE